MSWFSLVERTLDVLKLAVHDLQLADADALLARHYPNLSTDRPALIGPLTSTAVCQPLSDLLRRAYPEDHQVMLVGDVLGDSPVVQPVSVGSLDRADLGGLSLLYVPPLPYPGAVETFQATIAHLRAPDGCPWDREQTHQTLRQGFLEESYEVLDALDKGDLELLKEELGDVLLHILLQAQIASEQDEFRMSDVICQVDRKIVYRHPHVFGGLAVDGIGEVLTNWEALKRQEKGERAQAPSPFEGIPLSMPALARAQAMLRRAARQGVLAEDEDLVERLSRAVASFATGQAPGDRARFFGDLLFDLAGLAFKMDLDAESALREASARFERRVQETQNEPDVTAGEN
jgi:tetrapyrrole methylase family protein/MazG family protein